MSDTEKLRNDLTAVAKTGDIKAIRIVVKALDEAEKVEAKALKVKADAEWAEKSAARTELTERVNKAISQAVSGLKGDVVKLVGLDDAVVRYSIDYKNNSLVTCSIVRAQPKAVKSGNGGKHGKIQELFDAHATAEEKQALADEVATVKSNDATARVDGIEYKHRAKVEKRLIAAGTIQPRS